jgi:2-aminoadipate transaminase
VEAIAGDAVLDVVREVLPGYGSTTLQYGNGQGHQRLPGSLGILMAEEGVEADPEDLVVTTGAQRALDLLGKNLIDPDDLIAIERPEFVYTVPNFGNPSGVTRSHRRCADLVALCREAGIPIVEDNPYGMLRFEGESLPALRSSTPST